MMVLIMTFPPMCIKCQFIIIQCTGVYYIKHQFLHTLSYRDICSKKLVKKLQLHICTVNKKQYIQNATSKLKMFMLEMVLRKLVKKQIISTKNFRKTFFFFFMKTGKKN